MANYNGQTSPAVPQLSLTGKGYRQRIARTSTVDGSVLAGLVVKAYRLRSARSVQRTGTTAVTNRVYDSVAGTYVTWETSVPDIAGSYYPGPGVFASNTSQYAVIGVHT